MYTPVTQSTEERTINANPGNKRKISAPLRHYCYAESGSVIPQRKLDFLHSCRPVSLLSPFCIQKNLEAYGRTYNDKSLYKSISALISCDWANQPAWKLHSQ